MRVPLLLLLLAACSSAWDPCGKENDYCGESLEIHDSDGDGHDDYSVMGDDCDDNDAAVYPGAEPDCATIGADNNCDGYDDAYQCDVDGDGHTPEDGDCNDFDRDTYAGAAELCDGVDQNCNGIDDRSEPECTGVDDTGA